MVFPVLTPTKEPTTALAEDRFCEVRIKENIHNVSDRWQGSDTGMAHRVGIMCLHPNPVNNPRNIPWHFLCSPQLQRRRESPPYPWLILRHPPWWWRIREKPRGNLTIHPGDVKMEEAFYGSDKLHEVLEEKTIKRLQVKLATWIWDKTNQSLPGQMFRLYVLFQSNYLTHHSFR